MNNFNQSTDLINNEFVQTALYKEFKERFAKDVEKTLLTPGKELWIGEIGCLKSEIKNQGTKSKEVIENVKVKFVPSRKFRKEINKVVLGK